MSDETARALGSIEGELKGIREQLKKLDKIDERLRQVETRSMVNASVAGGVVSMGIGLLLATFRGMTNSGP